MIKIATAIYLEFPTTSVSIKNAKNGIIITLNIVILFGRFILSSSHSIISAIRSYSSDLVTSTLTKSPESRL